MKLNCAVLDDYQNVALAMMDCSVLDDVTVRTYCEHIDDEDALVAAIADCDIVVLMRERTPFKEALLAQLPRLRLIVTSGMRNASIELPAARQRGVTVCGTASGQSPPAELTWALILGLARHIVDEATALRTGNKWQSTIGADLNSRRLGILGLGKIGTRVAKVGAAFGMDIVAWSANLTPDRAQENGAKWVSKEELLDSSDFVSIHLVLSDRTRGLLGPAELQRMKRTAFLINTSRAQIVDQTALIDALKRGWIAGAALDVFPVEPLPRDDELRTLPNVLATPHLGYVTASNYATYFREAVEDIRAFLDGSPIRTLS